MANASDAETSDLDVSREQKLLDERFKEGATQCRHYELLSRTTISIYVPVVSAAFAYAFGRVAPLWAAGLILLVGAMPLSVGTAYTLWRLREFYRIYRDLLIKLEANELVPLYASAKSQIEELRVRTFFRGRPRFTNKAVPIYGSLAVGLVAAVAGLTMLIASLCKG